MRTGVWLIGARGSVATTATVGALALRAGLTGTTGCVTELPALRSPALPAWDDLVIGGHDVTGTPTVKKAEDLAHRGVLPVRLVDGLRDRLIAHEQNLRQLPDSIDRMVEDLIRFAAGHDLERTVVINVATTESALDRPVHRLDDLPPSSRAAYAAFTAGCSYVDFTPSTGARLPLLHDLAVARQVPYAGNDGKTGETLVKSVLAPMFAARNLRVRSWSGLNLLGGGDGANLVEPGPNAAKVASKQRVLRETLGYQPQGDSRIDYVEDIGDFKTAWDLITFGGFLETGMRVEFTWHGCDSALAAPLILDLARLTAAAHAAGRTGPLPELGFFFKDPIGSGPAGLADQFQALTGFAATLCASGS